MVDDRTKQIELATKVGIKNPELMNPQELRRVISRSPATAEQLKFVAALLRYKQMPMPEGQLTFGQASGILSQVTPLINDDVLMQMQWCEGCIIAWRGGYYQLVNIHTSKMVTLKRVELVRDDVDGPARVEPAGNKLEQHHPFTLHEDGAVKVDLNTVEL